MWLAPLSVFLCTSWCSFLSGLFPLLCELQATDPGVEDLVLMRQLMFGIGLGVFVAGGLVYAILQLAGLDSLEAGVWSQLLLVGGLVVGF